MITPQQFPNAQATSNDSLLITFLNQFVNQEFLEDIINVAIYQADINAFNQRHDQVSNLDKIKLFLADIHQDIERLKKVNALGNYPINLVKINIAFAKRVIELKTSIGVRLLTYDTLEDTFNKSELHIVTIIKRVKEKRLTNIDDFKYKLNEIINKIQIGEEIRSIKKSFAALDDVKKALNSKDPQILNTLFNYRNAIDVASEDLSKLKSINLSDSLSNSIMIGDGDESINDAVDNLVQYLSSGYAFYKTGYDIIDQNIGGIEAANFHLICGPSNNAKSLFMINLLYNMIYYNRHEFDANDVVLYITLEDKLNTVLVKSREFRGTPNR